MRHHRERINGESAHKIRPLPAFRMRANREAIDYMPAIEKSGGAG
jgi:hypothetical protein